MTSTDPWAEKSPADPHINWAPTIYADDPPAVVDFLTHRDNLPNHLTHDAAYAGDDDGDES